MLSDKIKVRISPFIALIIDNDAQSWGFVKGDDSSNKNAFLNKLIPNMVALRKERREEIRELLENDYQRDDAEKVYECVNTVIDQVYFRDEELDNLTEDVWIRPDREHLSIFDEIETEELAVTMLDMSAYIRGLLNEYVRLPQYKRQQILFREEKDLINEACVTERILRFFYDGERYKVYAYWMMYQYSLKQQCYLVAYDLERREIRSFFLEKIKEPYMLKKKFIPPQPLEELLTEYCESGEYNEDTVLIIEEKSDEK